MLLQLIVVISLRLLSTVLPYSIVVDSDDFCSSTNILCLSENSFAYCSTYENYLVVSKTEWFCPATYTCSNAGTSPCILPPSLTTTTTEATTTTTTTTTTTPTTTSTTISTTSGTTTTVGPPSCSTHSYSKGPTCSQYYECVSVWWWFEARLQTCASGLYFSLTQSACVAPEASGCT